MRTKKRAQKKASGKTPVIDVTRKIHEFTRLLLFVRSGGYCQFDGCPAYLLEHHVTLTKGMFAEMAHIVAFSKAGPRGNSMRPENINSVNNLMTLCPTCHKLIDDNPEDYSRETLVKYKELHEKRIRHLTSLKPKLKTSVLVLKSKIGDQVVDVSFDQILDAIAPRYPITQDVFTIDLTQLTTKSKNFIQTACDAVDENLRIFFSPNGEYRKTGNISLFALAPIPVLAYLGSKLSNKVRLDLFQRHRDKEDWKWKATGRSIGFRCRKLRGGSHFQKVALIISVSGVVDWGNLPQEIDDGFSIYELTLNGRAASPTALRKQGDLERFRLVYQDVLASITAKHKSLQTISLFPAVPAPIAVLCGRELIPKAHPKIRVYDYDKKKKGFTYQLTINNV